MFLLSKRLRIIKFLIYLLFSFTLLCIQTFPTNNNWPIFSDIKPNYVYVFLIGLYCFTSTKTASIISISTIICIDLISNGYFGYYSLSFYVSLIFSIFFKKNFSTIPIPLFVLIVLTVSIIKETIEIILIIILIDFFSASNYFKQYVVGQIIINGLLAPFVFLLFKGIDVFFTYLFKKKLRKKKLI